MHIIETYKCLDSINKNMFCYIHIITNIKLVDYEHKSPKRIYNFLVGIGYINDVKDSLMIFEFYTLESYIEIKIIQNKDCDDKIQFIKEEINKYNDILNGYLEINGYMGTITYYNYNKLETDEEGSVMFMGTEVGDLMLEKLLKITMKIKNVVVIEVDKIL